MLDSAGGGEKETSAMDFSAGGSAGTAFTFGGIADNSSFVQKDGFGSRRNGAI